jgi:hypothetical protein
MKLSRCAGGDHIGQRPATFSGAGRNVNCGRSGFDEVPSPSATSGPKTTLSTSVTGTASATSSIDSTAHPVITSIISSAIPEATPPPPEPITVTSHRLKPSVIGGIVASLLALAILCAGLGYFYWKSSKQAKRKTREVAILSDRVSGCGFQKYIDDLLADGNSDSHGDSNSSTGMIVWQPTPTASVQEMVVGSTTTADGVQSQLSSVYSVDIARAF